MNNTNKNNILDIQSISENKYEVKVKEKLMIKNKKNNNPHLKKNVNESSLYTSTL
jgi:coenzyme F420-reducing hydrogenase beta subunit